MKLSKNSSIHWLATIGYMDVRSKTDICTLLKQVLIGFGIAAITAAAITAAAITILLLVAGILPFHLLMYIVTGVSIMTGPLAMLLVSLIMAAIIAAT